MLALNTTVFLCLRVEAEMHPGEIIVSANNQIVISARCSVFGKTKIVALELG